MLKRFVEGCTVACLVLALAVPAQAVLTVNAYGSIKDPMASDLPFTLSIETATDDTCHYGAAVDAVPDTLDWPRHALLFGPVSPPTNLFVNWKVEENMTWGYVQFKERSLDSDTYAWGDVARLNLAILENTAPELGHEFRVGLWDSVRVWAGGSADGLCSISVIANVLE